MALWPLTLFLALHGYREYCARRALPQIHHADFEGEVMQVGSTYIARRSSRNGNNKTIVCFPGFLEDMRYFQDLYRDSDAELILVNNANYHFPFTAPGTAIDPIQLDWPENPFLLGSIEHDAFYLGLLLQELTTGQHIVVHGHSRGGAVILDTGRQYPSFAHSSHRPVSVVLEAPVLPQARTAGNASKPLQHGLTCYLMPIAFSRWRHISEDRLLKMPMMQPTTPRKTELCRSLFSVSRDYRTCVRQVQSIVKWQRQASIDVFDHFPNITVVIGEKDGTLDRESMKISAESGRARNNGVSILETTGTNHLISLEQPEILRALVR